jgi:hypothetical protein
MTAINPPHDVSGNPWRRAYWIGGIDARIPALFRIAVGAVFISDLVDRLRDLFTFFTDLGVVPRDGLVGTRLVSWSIFYLSGRPWPTAALFLLGFPVAIAFTVGYRTRAATILGWIYVNSLMNRNPFVGDGGDAVLRLLLFWGMFADLGARFSADCRLGRRAPQATVPVIAVRCLQLQIMMIYFFTFFAKSGESWRHGTAVWRVFENLQWSRGLGPLLARHQNVCRLLTWGTLAVEGSFTLLMLSPWRPRLTRAVAITLGTALHLGIFLTIRVGIFSLIMPASYVIFAAPEWIDGAQGWLARRWPFSARLSPLVPAPAPEAPRLAGWPARRRAAGLVLLALTFVPALAGQVLFARSWKTPRPIDRWLAVLSLKQDWRMFSPDTPTSEVTWTAPGFLTDGRPVEVTAAVAPGLRRPDGFVYTRWHKLGNNLFGQPQNLLRGVGRYLCRRYNGNVAGPKLERFDLAAVWRPVIPPGPPTEVSYLRQRCLPAAPAGAVTAR